MTDRDSHSPPVAAVLRAGSPEETPGLLREGLQQTDLWDRLIPNARRRRSGALIVVTLSRPAPAHHRVVEELVDALSDRGWSSIRVAGAVTISDLDSGDHDLAVLARDSGLTGRTTSGRGYGIVDLNDDVATATAPPDSVLAGRPVSRAWVESGLRVLLARNASDLGDGFAGCLDLLATTAPPIPGAALADVAVDLHRLYPADIAVVDAATSSHGISGRSRLEPLDTSTLVVAGDALLADVVTAMLQGLDPGASRVVQQALHRVGLPQGQRVVGDLTPFVGWRSAPAVVRDAVRSSGVTGERLAAAALRRGDVDPDGFGDPVLDAVRRGVGALADLDGGALLAAVLGYVAYNAASYEHLLNAWMTAFAKDKVARVELPLAFDPAEYDESAYHALPDHLAPLERLLEGVPEGPGGLRWRRLDRSVLFEVSRVLEAPFDEFVERVDISQGISLMADYLGGCAVPVALDEQGRHVLQAERNIYLPQPNYLALWGSPPIDVCKIELVERLPDRHRLLWRTVASPNGSATYDDGALTFAAASGGRTRVAVLGRQMFTLPPFWQVVDLDRFPEIKAPLVEDAYRRFFSATFDNLEACFEGRDHRIGKEPEATPLPTQRASALLEGARGWLRQRSVTQPGAAVRVGAHQPPEVDVHGFRHFSADLGRDPAPSAQPLAVRLLAQSQGLAEEYVAAVAEDWARMVRP